MSDIRARRDAVLKSSISIKAIGNSVTNFTKGLFKARTTASEIAQQTNESNKFKRTLIGKDDTYFRKRRENARRIQREDELEASTVQGVTKRQGALVSRSTKGFLGRIMDFFGIVLIGWFVNQLPGIIKAISGLIDRVRKVTTILTNFIDYIGDFLSGIRIGITDAISRLPKIDLLGLKKSNDDELDAANNNLALVSKDILDVAAGYNQGGRLFDLKEDGEQDIEDLIVPPDTPEPPTTQGGQDEGKNEIDDTKSEPKESTTDSSDNSGNNKTKDSDSVEGVPSDNLIDDIKNKEAQERSGNETEESIEENEDNEKKEDDTVGLVDGVKGFITNFFKGKGKEESTDEKPEEENASTIAAKFKSDIKSIDKKAKDILKSDDIVNAMKTERSFNFNGGQRDRNKVMVIEKAVPVNSGGGGGASGSGSSKTMNLKNEDSEQMKNGIKKLQSIILNK